MKFITFEGIDGSGKTSIVAEIKNRIQEQFPDRKVFTLNDPSSTIPETAFIRKMVLEDEDLQLNSTEELSFFLHARRHLINHIRKEHENTNDIILCDRYCHSTYAYQCGGNGTDESVVDQMTKEIIPTVLYPDATLFLDIPLSVSKTRRRERKHDKMETKSDEYFERVIARYRKFEGTPNFHTIDATANFATVLYTAVTLLVPIIREVS